MFKNQKFNGDEDWLRGLTIHVKNVSGKRILFASIDLFFSSAEPGGPHAIDQVEYGNRQLLTRSPTSNELGTGIEPQQEVDIRLEGINYDRIRSLLAEVGAVDVPRLKISVGRVIFDDDVTWYAGSHFQQEGTEAGFWNNIDKGVSPKQAVAAAKSAAPPRKAKVIWVQMPISLTALCLSGIICFHRMQFHN